MEKLYLKPPLEMAKLKIKVIFILKGYHMNMIIFSTKMLYILRALIRNNSSMISSP